MVSKIESHDHQQLSALSGLKKKMTPKIIDASSCISSPPLQAANPITPRHIKQQSATKQLNSVKWQSTNGVVVVNHSPIINGFIIRPASDNNQPLKRHSPKSVHNNNKNDHHQQQQQQQLHYHSFQQQQQAQQQMSRQPTQRYSPSRVSPTVANGGIRRGSSAPPVSNASAGAAYYAGAKFSEPPAPDALPKPPTHWMSSSEAELIAGTVAESTNNYPFGLGSKCCAEISDRIKILLKMQQA